MVIIEHSFPIMVAHIHLCILLQLTIVLCNEIRDKRRNFLNFCQFQLISGNCLQLRFSKTSRCCLGFFFILRHHILCWLYFNVCARWDEKVHQKLQNYKKSSRSTFFCRKLIKKLKQIKISNEKHFKPHMFLKLRLKCFLNITT